MGVNEIFRICWGCFVANNSSIMWYHNDWVIKPGKAGNLSEMEVYTVTGKDISIIYYGECLANHVWLLEGTGILRDVDRQWELWRVMSKYHEISSYDNFFRWLKDYKFIQVFTMDQWLGRNNKTICAPDRLMALLFGLAQLYLTCL